MPPLPKELYKKYTEQLQLSDYDAGIIIDSKPIALYYESIIAHTGNYKAAANWLMGEVKSYVNQNAIHIDDFPVKPENIALLISLIDEDLVSNSIAAEQLFPKMIAEPERNPKDIAESENLLQKSDDTWLRSLAQEALDKYPEKVDAYRKGNKGLLGLFMGEVMKLSERKANPIMASQLIKELLDE